VINGFGVARGLLVAGVTTAKETPMPNEILSIDPHALEGVTGGSHKKSHGDPVLNDLNRLASSIKDLTNTTSGFSSTQMLLLCCLVMRDQSTRPNVVYVNRGRSW
jgi:hypothetical protein